MNRCIDFRGSVLGGFSEQGRNLIVELRPVWVHESDGKPGRDAGIKYSHQVNLSISRPGPRSVLANLPAPLDCGSLSVGPWRYDDLVPLPIVYSGPCSFRCRTDYGEALVIRGQGIAVVFCGERGPGEAFARGQHPH